MDDAGSSVSQRPHEIDAQFKHAPQHAELIHVDESYDVALSRFNARYVTIMKKDVRDMLEERFGPPLVDDVAVIEEMADRERVKSKSDGRERNQPRH